MLHWCPCSNFYDSDTCVIDVGGQSNRTIWVGKIAPTVEPETMKEILQACGSLKEWKPVIGPNKGFGFATFHDSIGVLAAQKMLNGLELDGQCLLIKCNSVRV